MTQPSTSANHLLQAQSISEQQREAEDRTKGASHLSDSEQPAIVHPNFDPNQTPLDPARPLTDIPEPARRADSQLRRLYGKHARLCQRKKQSSSKWQLIASKPFAEHLALLSAAKLIEIPDSFYRPYAHSSTQTAQTLLSPLEHMSLLDLSDIQQVISQYPKLTRYGFKAQKTADKPADDQPVKEQPSTPQALTKHHNPDELLNSLYADDWQVILQPELFETGKGSLATDIMASSVAVHALKQCITRKTINHSYSAAQICHYVRSYLLSQIYHTPAQCYQYRQIRLFAGHIIVAAAHLGWEIQVRDEDCYFNISSRSALLTRYANMQDYYINGWSGT